MKKQLFALGCALICAFPITAFSATLATGQVYRDDNGNGQQDKGEAGIAGIRVSNGRDIVTTDAHGHYRITLQDGDILFVIKPADYRFPINDMGLPVFWQAHFPEGSPALKYGQFPAIHADRVNFALLPDKAQKGKPLDVLVIADSQVGNGQELDFYQRSILAHAAQHKGIALGLTLGDLVNDTLALYPALNRQQAALGIPWLHAPGNHDLDLDASDDSQSLLTYRRHYGPDTLAWEWPGMAFISLDDVIHQPGQKPAYIGGLREDQFQFLENYLAMLPADTQIVISLHIPLFDNPDETFRHADRERLFALLKPFPSPLILSGHTHNQRHHFHDAQSGWLGAEPLHEYNVGAACGGFWGGLPDQDGLPDTRMSDGTPSGYAVVRFANGGYDTRYYASRGREGLRIGLSSPGVLRQGAYPSYAVYANVFAAEPEARVEYRIDEGDWQPMQRVLESDPELVALNVDDQRSETLRSFDRAVPARNSPHLWKGRLPTDLMAGEHRVHVRVKSRFEGEYSAETHYRLAAWEAQ